MPLYSNPVLIQTKGAALASNQNTNSNTFSTLFSTTITTAGGTYIRARALMNGSNTSPGATNRAQLLINGVVVDNGAMTCGDGGALSATPGPNNVSLEGASAALTAGTYTVEVQFAASGGTLNVRAVAQSTTENCSIEIEELTQRS